MEACNREESLGGAGRWEERGEKGRKDCWSSQQSITKAITGETKHASSISAGYAPKMASCSSGRTLRKSI